MTSPVKEKIDLTKFQLNMLRVTTPVMESSWLDEVDLSTVTIRNKSMNSEPVETDGKRGRYREIKRLPQGKDVDSVAFCALKGSVGFSTTESRSTVWSAFRLCYAFWFPWCLMVRSCWVAGGHKAALLVCVEYAGESVRHTLLYLEFLNEVELGAGSMSRSRRILLGSVAGRFYRFSWTWGLGTSFVDALKLLLRALCRRLLRLLPKGLFPAIASTARLLPTSADRLFWNGVLGRGCASREALRLTLLTSLLCRRSQARGIDGEERRQFQHFFVIKGRVVRVLDDGSLGEVDVSTGSVWCPSLAIPSLRMDAGQLGNDGLPSNKDALWTCGTLSSLYISGRA